MAVSSTQLWNMSIDEIVDEAQQRVTGELSTGYDARRAKRALNLLQQEFLVRGINLWKIEEQSIPLSIGVETYTLDTNVLDIPFIEQIIRDTALAPNSDLVINRISRDEYIALPDKTVQGRPVQYMFMRLRDAPTVTFWPVPNIDTYEFVYYAQTKFYDVDRMSYDMDVPIWWMPAVVSGLAWTMAKGMPKEIDAARRMELKADYDRDYEYAAAQDRDTSGVRIRPDLGVYQRIT